MSRKGISMQEGQAGVLELDGTLVYVEQITEVCASVVALPEQPATRQVTPVFTPGAVRAKKISPYSSFAVVVTHDELSPRNQNFVLLFQRWREEHGMAYVDLTPEEKAQRAAAEVAAAVLPKSKAERKAEKAAAKATKKALKATPRYLQRCATCNEQPGHPDHGEGEGKHVFVAPEPPVAGAPKPAPRTPKSKRTTQTGPFTFVGDQAKLDALAAGNPKYKPGNSGRCIADYIGECGVTGATTDQVVAELGAHPKWSGVPRERIELALKQLLDGGLIVEA